MLTESFIAATLAANKPSQHTSSALKDVGIFLHELQPQSVIRHGYKKSSVNTQCLATSQTHIFAAQADKAIVNIYSRAKGNQEATVPFPDRIRSLIYAENASILVLGTEGGKLILWEVATGRLSTSTASHLQPISLLCISGNDDYILSGSTDTNIHVWSIPNLVSFRKPKNLFDDEVSTNSPMKTFSNHRTSITALTCGHSKYATNFAISASDDRTCYLWHIETSQIIRTFLLPSAPLCIAIDPVDRAIYLGDAKGCITMIDILRTTLQASSSNTSSSGDIPIQISKSNVWIPPSDQMGSANCLTISYDGTALISGHDSGLVIKWDVAKGKVMNEVANLMQPVTNISVLRPDGLPRKHTNSFILANVVKPKLEFNAQQDNGHCGIPAGYTLQAMISPNLQEGDEANNDVYRALNKNGFPQSIIDDALQALVAGPNSQNSKLNAGSNDRILTQVEQLQDQIAILKQQLAATHHIEEERTARRMIRMQKREELGLKKRQAYFDAKSIGKDGDFAMKQWEDQEAMLDVESDDEYLGEGMKVD